jgi:deazaflavin-dependent oxidoreductase (nitroreductase family)
MRTPAITHRVHHGSPAGHVEVNALWPVGRFLLHLVEMCMVMCAGAIALSVLFFGTASLMGFTNLPQQAPELSVLVIALNLSLPMAAWMRFRGMAWRPTLEMSGTTMVFGLLLIVAYGADLVAKDGLVDLQTSAACPLMLVVMLFRPRLYSSHHHGVSARTVKRNGPLPRGFARFNRRFANPVIRHVAGSIGPLTLIRHRGRRTGRAFSTPVMSFTTDDGLVIGVVYGSNSDWVKNVCTSPRVEVKRRGQSRQYEAARLVERDQGLDLVPAIVRGAFRALGVRHFVRLTSCGTSSR